MINYIKAEINIVKIKIDFVSGQLYTKKYGTVHSLPLDSNFYANSQNMIAILFIKGKLPTCPHYLKIELQYGMKNLGSNYFECAVVQGIILYPVI